MLDINANPSNGTVTPLSLELSLCLECGLNGKWVAKHSNIREVGRGSVEPTQALRPTDCSKPNQLDPSINVSKPKPNLVWRPKSNVLNSLSCPIWSSTLSSVTTSPAVVVLSSGGLGDAPILPSPSLSSTFADAQFHVPDKVNDARFMLSALPDLNPASDVVEAVLLGFDGLGDAPISPSLSSTVADAQFHIPDKVDKAKFMLSALPNLYPASDVVEAVLLGSDVTDEAKIEPACTTDTDSEEGLV